MLYNVNKYQNTKFILNPNKVTQCNKNNKIPKKYYSYKRNSPCIISIIREVYRKHICISTIDSKRFTYNHKKKTAGHIDQIMNIFHIKTKPHGLWADMIYIKPTNILKTMIEINGFNNRLNNKNLELTKVGNITIYNITIISHMRILDT